MSVAGRSAGDSVIRLLGGATAVVVMTAGWSPAAAPLPPDPTATQAAQAVLELTDGFAVGQLGPPPAAAAAGQREFTWNTPTFPRPFAFPWNGIARVRLPPAQPPAMPAGAWRADLGGGSGVVGVLEAVDAEHVTMTVPGVGTAPLRLQRDAIVRLTREGSTTNVLVPGTLAGWDADRKAWREEAGRIVGSSEGGGLCRDIAIPGRACIEIAISWDERPDFEIAVAASKETLADLKSGGGGKRVSDSYRIETAASGELLAVREGGREARIGIAETLAKEAGRLWMRVFIDQESGRLALTLTHGEGDDKPVFDQALQPAKPTPAGGFGIRLRRGRLRIERLRVRPWTEQEPRMTEVGGLGGPNAVLESFDKAAGTFVVNDAGESRQVAVQQVGEVSFRKEEQGPRPTEGLMVVFHGGAMLRGRVLELAPPGLRLEIAGVSEPVACDLGQVAVLENLAVPTAAKPAGRIGTLEASGMHLPGWLANGAEAGIGWQPRTGAAANLLSGAKGPLRIVYRADEDAAARQAAGPGIDRPSVNVVVPPHQVIPGQPQPAAAAPVTPFPGGKSLLYLRTGDAVLCKVLSADAQGVRIRNDAGAEVIVPSAAIRAVELVATASQLVAQTKADRLRVLPRVQKADPPTHLLRLGGGDYIRGKLTALDDNVVRIEVAGAAQAKELRRADVTRVIWLSVEGDGSDAAAIAAIAAGLKPEDVPVRALLAGPEGSRRVTCTAQRVDGDKLIGRNGVLGEIAVDLASCISLEVGPAAVAAPDGVPYGQWRLKPAAVPRALQTDK